MQPQNQQPNQTKPNAAPRRFRFKRDGESRKLVREAMDEMRRLRGIRRMNRKTA